MTAPNHYSRDIAVRCQSLIHHLLPIIIEGYLSLEMKTPEELASEELFDNKIISLVQYRWKSQCI